MKISSIFAKVVVEITVVYFLWHGVYVGHSIPIARHGSVTRIKIQLNYN